MQNKAVKAITNSKQRSKLSPLYVKCELLKLEDIIDLDITKFAYNLKYKILPLPLLDLFIVNETVHNHNTRQAQDPHIVPYSKDIVQRSFLHKVPYTWSTLPLDIKDAPSKSSFSRRYKKYVLANY